MHSSRTPHANPSLGGMKRPRRIRRPASIDLRGDHAGVTSDGQSKQSSTDPAADASHDKSAHRSITSPTVQSSHHSEDRPHGAAVQIQRDTAAVPQMQPTARRPLPARHDENSDPFSSHHRVHHRDDGVQSSRPLTRRERRLQERLRHSSLPLPRPEEAPRHSHHQHQADDHPETDACSAPATPPTPAVVEHSKHHDTVDTDASTSSVPANLPASAPSCPTPSTSLDHQDVHHDSSAYRQERPRRAQPHHAPASAYHAPAQILDYDSYTETRIAHQVSATSRAQSASSTVEDSSRMTSMPDQLHGDDTLRQQADADLHHPAPLGSHRHSASPQRRRAHKHSSASELSVNRVPHRLGHVLASIVGHGKALWWAIVTGLLTEIHTRLHQIRHHWRMAGQPLQVSVGVIALMMLAYTASAAVLSGQTPQNTVISGVNVGGMSKAQAEKVLHEHLSDALSQPLTITAQGGSALLYPQALNVSLDTENTLSPLTDFTLNPLTLAKRAFTHPHQPARTRVDMTGLRYALESDLPALSTGLRNADVTLNQGRVTITPGQSGRGVDIPRTLAILTSTWPLYATEHSEQFAHGQATIRSVGSSILMELPETTVAPPISDTAAEIFVHDVVDPVLSGPITMLPPQTAAKAGPEAGGDLAPLTLTTDQLMTMARVEAVHTTLTLSMDTDQLQRIVTDAYGQSLATTGTNAQWSIAGGKDQAPTIIPATQGTDVDIDALGRAIVIAGSAGGTDADAQLLAAGVDPTDPTALAQAREVKPGSRQVTIPLGPRDPDVTESDLLAMGMTSVVGEYSTPFSSEPNRDKNLIQGCALINGHIIQPGETFSVNDALGTVDQEHGFAEAGVIVAEEHVDAMGGGLSQVGTTVFNAAFEAGMDDVEHTPHSQYISRYPEGREATIWTGDKDVKFTNSTPYPVLIQAWVEQDHVNVRLWSTPYYDVTITTSERSNIIPFDTVVKYGPECYPQPEGEPGFDVTVWRTRSHDGQLVSEESRTVHYNPHDAVVCE